ncbi:hypothetical protein B0H14DRAFT_2629546 [Mycena olivaceomarginata]|nr:hypothetical protein B0H14DRAFT_2629546 [Mycena olivaceomarginata]
MPPMVRSMSFPRAPVRTSPTSGEKPKPTRGVEAQSRKRAVPILPVLRPLRIDDADDSAVCHTRAAAAARFRRRAGGRGEDGEMTVIDERDFGQDGEGDEELPMPVPWWSDLLAPPLTGAPPTYYRSEGEGEEPQTPVPGLYLREATPTPTPYSEREGEQVGGKRKR